MARPKILVVGSTNTDMVVEVAKLPRAGETVLGGLFRQTPGGKGANQAVAAARAGGEVTFLTAVGDDAFGTESIVRFGREGIETCYIAIKPGIPSGVALIMVDERGENLIAVAPGANRELVIDDLLAADKAFDGCQLMIAQLEILIDSVIWAAARTARAGGTVLLNPAPMPVEGLPAALLNQVDILTPNEVELRALAPQAMGLEDAAAAVLAQGPSILVVTQGSRGATVFTADGSFHVPAAKVQTIDTVGAGDCFSACLGVALAEGHSLPDAVRFAVTAAALSTMKAGAQESMPSREAIEQALSGS